MPHPTPPDRIRPVAGTSRSERPPEGRTPLPTVEESVASLWQAVERTLTFPDAARRGLSPRGARWLDAASVAVLLLFGVGWSWSIAEARGGPVLPVTSRVAGAVAGRGGPPVAYLMDAALAATAPSRGLSGALRAAILEPGDSLPMVALPHAAQAALLPADSLTPAPTAAPAAGSVRRPPPGIWRLAVTLGRLSEPVRDFSVITARPLAERRDGRFGRYQVGVWPTERAPRSGYVTPRGMIEVTPSTRDTPLSTHFVLGDFLTKGQADVWPKYVVVRPALVDKLELVLAELRARGVRTEGVTVMSGFRTPNYNATGGNTKGRATMSRHIYGDAADVYLDGDGDGVMDDLTGDGRSTIADARVLLDAAEAVERRHPSLVGGVGVYPAGPGHGPFAHIDVRGYRARWTGGPGGG